MHVIKSSGNLGTAPHTRMSTISQEEVTEEGTKTNARALEIDERMFLQKMRVSEITFVLRARGFTVAIPDDWRVRIKAMQMNSIVSDWAKLGNIIVMNCVKKIAKSLVLKNGVKTLVGSLTGVAFKANGSSATRDHIADTEEESAAILFGKKK